MELDVPGGRVEEAQRRRRLAVVEVPARGSWWPALEPSFCRNCPCCAIGLETSKHDPPRHVATAEAVPGATWPTYLPVVPVSVVQAGHLIVTSNIIPHRGLDNRRCMLMPKMPLIQSALRHSLTKTVRSALDTSRSFVLCRPYSKESSELAELTPIHLTLNDSCFVASSSRVMRWSIDMRLQDARLPAGTPTHVVRR